MMLNLQGTERNGEEFIELVTKTILKAIIFWIKRPRNPSNKILNRISTDLKTRKCENEKFMGTINCTL